MESTLGALNQVQGTDETPPPVSGQQPASGGPPHQRLKIIIGQSLIVDSVEQIERVSVTKTEMVDAIVISPQQILLNGKSPGLTTFIMWDKTGGYTVYDITVQRDVSLLIEKLHEIDKNIRVEVQAANDSVILWGKVANAAVITKAVIVATAFFGGGELKIKAGPGGTILKEGELPLIAAGGMMGAGGAGGGGAGGGGGGGAGGGGGGVSSGGGMAGMNVTKVWNVSEGAIITADNNKVISFLEVAEPQQVELQVRIAEIDRTALKELGVNLRFKLSGFDFFTVPMGLPPLGPALSKAATGIIDSHNVLIQALEEKGLATVLAEPNLTAISGQQASFLVGGEFPYLEASEAGGVRALTVRWKNFGIRLDFTPEVKESGMINLKVSPEVSVLDRDISIRILDSEIPGLKVRRAETTVEISEGNSLIIGGLISRELTRELTQVPWIGDIPYIGALFRSTRFINNETELVILITPRLVKPLTHEQIPALSKVLTGLPSDYELFLMGHLEGSNEMAGPFGHSL